MGRRVNRLFTNWKLLSIISAVHHNKYRAIDLATLDLIKQILYNGLISEKEVMEWVKTLL